VRYLDGFGNDWWPNGIAISPDDSAVLYDAPSRDDPLQRDIFLLPTDGGPEQPLVTGPSNDVWPLWVPGEQAILFLSDRSGTMALWGAAIEGGDIGEPVLLKPDMAHMSPLGVSRDGAFFYTVRIEGSDIYTTELDVESGQRLAPVRRMSMLNIGHNLEPAWSPDGTKLAFVTRRGGLMLESDRDRLTVVDLQTGQQRMLTPDLNVFRSPSWSPDGSAIRVNNYGPNGLYEVDAQSGEVTPLLVDRGFLGQPAFSPDGTRVYYKQRRRLWEHDFTTGETRQLYERAGLLPPFVSPDGTQIALLVHRDAEYRELVLIPVDGSPPRSLARLEGSQRRGLFHGWSSDGAGLFYSVRPEGTDLQLWYLPVEDGERRQLELTYTGYELTFHPAGRQVAFTNNSPRVTVWMLQNFLPDFSAQR
jgi:Tol biopolymer transport system component